MSIEALSINERLKKSVSAMKRLQKLENKKKNAELQTKIDAKYRELVHQTAQLCHSVHYAQEQFSFSYQPQLSLLGLLNDMESAATRGAVEEDFITGAAKRLKPVQDQMKKEWSKHYPTIVTSAINTLNIIQRIDPAHVNQCLTDLKSAEVWRNNDDDFQHLQKLSAALKSSNMIIEQLNLDQEVITFLTKISLNNATLNDLTDSILEWIRTEKLSDRIGISFK